MTDNYDAQHEASAVASDDTNPLAHETAVEVGDVQESSVADSEGTNEVEDDGENLDYLFDHLQDLNDNQTLTLFTVLDELDPLEMVDGNYRWTSQQRDVIGEAQTAYKEAGYGA